MLHCVMTAELRKLDRVSFRDVAGRLRKLAEEVEADIAAGGVGYNTVVVVLASGAGHLSVRSMGDRSTGLETCGWLSRALSLMAYGKPSEADEWSGHF